MKYIIVQQRASKEVALTRPSTKKQAINSLAKLSAIGIENISIQNISNKKYLEQDESSYQILKAKQDFERFLEDS